MCGEEKQPWCTAIEIRCSTIVTSFVLYSTELEIVLKTQKCDRFSILNFAFLEIFTTFHLEKKTATAYRPWDCTIYYLLTHRAGTI